MRPRATGAKAPEPFYPTDMIIEETKTGARRHTMSRAELEHLYKEIERFVADSTTFEYRVHEQAIKEIQALIHQRMRTADVPGIINV